MDRTERVTSTELERACVQDHPAWATLIALSRVAVAKRRFCMPISPGKMGTICKGVVPTNTKKATSWALHVFKEWRKESNRASTGEKCPSTLLEPDARSLNYWLSRFIVEMRTADGNPYPPTSISNVLAGMYRYSKKHTPDCPNFMDQKHFRDVTGVLQVRYCDFRKEGIRNVVKHAPVVTAEGEDALWKSNVLHDGTPSLQRAVFFYVGKCFCLRGGEVQKLSQLLLNLIVTHMFKKALVVQTQSRPTNCICPD